MHNLSNSRTLAVRDVIEATRLDAAAVVLPPGGDLTPVPDMVGQAVGSTPTPRVLWPIVS